MAQERLHPPVAGGFPKSAKRRHGRRWIAKRNRHGLTWADRKARSATYCAGGKA